MGDFRIIIDAVGGHGQDRSKKSGEIVDFTNGDPNSKNPEVLAKRLIDKLKANGCTVQGARIEHWPTDNYPKDRKAKDLITDDLLTGERKGNF